MKKITFYLLFALSSIQFVAADTYKVATETDFKNTVPKLLPGDQLIIANGTYQDWAVEIPVSGTALKPITIKAETLGKVIFSGNVGNTIFKFTGDHVILSGISFQECTLVKADGKTGLLVDFNNTNYCSLTKVSFIKNRAKVQFSPFVVVSGNGSYNQIKHCDFSSNIDNQDVQVKITKDSCPVFTTISNNSFSNKTKVSWKNGNGGECIQIGQDPILLGNKTAKALIQHNRFIGCNAENEIISNKSSSNTYSDNYFKDNNGELVMRGGHDCVIAGNTFEGGTGGIRINGSGHQVINNKISNIKTAIRLMYGMAKGKEETGFYIAASNCIIKGNTISDASIGILIGDSKNIDWTGKFDTNRYPSRVMQDVAPFDNLMEGNKFSSVAKDISMN